MFHKLTNNCNGKTRDPIKHREINKVEKAIDLESAFMVPGIHDVQLHPLEAETENFQFILDNNIQDPEEYAVKIADALKKIPVRVGF